MKNLVALALLPVFVCLSLVVSAVPPAEVRDSAHMEQMSIQSTGPVEEPVLAICLPIYCKVVRPVDAATGAAA